MLDLEHLDWSFGLVIAMVGLLVTVLVVRHVAQRRRERRTEKRERHAAYRAWLNSSGMELPKGGKRKR